MDETQKQIAQRWADTNSYSDGWRSRAKSLVKLAGDNSKTLLTESVVDLGCGPSMFIHQELEKIDHQGSITMLDLQSWSSAVIAADLNNGLPDEACIPGAVYFISGVLEYILHPMKLIQTVGTHASMIVFSYACINFKSGYKEINETPSAFASMIKGRIKSGWTSHLSSSTIIDNLPNGFRLVDMRGHGETMALFVLKRAY